MSDSTHTVPAADDLALFGHDRTPRIVALHPVAGLESSAQAMMRVYQRQSASTDVTSQDVPWYPFFFLTDIRLLQDFPRARYRHKTLQGQNAYRSLVVFTTWQDHWDAVSHVERLARQQGAHPAPLYRIASPTQQYCLQTGRTLFKDMTFDEVHRLQLDIEVITDESFPHPEREADRIILIALSDNRGWRHLLDGRSCAEPAMLAELVQLIRQRDPDVIEGHNIFAFDLAYIMARCARAGVSCSIGRDGSVPRTYQSNMRFAERSIDFPVLDIAGRHVIDTYLQVLAFDVYKRDLPDYSLKTAARYFGLAPEHRTYIEGHEISRVWRHDPERLIAYAYDDVLETARLARHLSGSTFYLTQMLPMAYGQVARTGPAAKIEALFVREYLRQRHSLPHSTEGSQLAGGYTDVFVTGVVGPIVYVDVESLYPSIMLTQHIRPASDSLELFQAFLRRLTDLRLRTKHQMQAASTPEARSALDAQQSSYKILINSFYGQLGFRHALFNDFPAADRVATTGQAILRQMISAIRQAGGTVIEVDTDGVLFVPPAEVADEAAERRFVAGLGAAMPPGIRLGYEGRFRKMLSYKMKNYALLAYDGTLRFKGSALVSRSTEAFGRRFMRDAIALLLQEDIAGLHALYLHTRQRILQHDWGSEDFARTETLKTSVEHYQADVAAGRRSKSAAYELAMARSRATGQPVRKGDRLTYYITGSSAQVTTFDKARLAEVWDSLQPDENTEHYLKRLDECARRLAPFFTPQDFQHVFSPEDLFGFSAAHIQLQTTLNTALIDADAAASR
ncbi:MAG: DNA polymerase domain-containing protein [Candidatus Tectimicrobiota bacterium]